MSEKNFGFGSPEEAAKLRKEFTLKNLIGTGHILIQSAQQYAGSISVDDLKSKLDRFEKEPTNEELRRELENEIKDVTLSLESMKTS